MSKKYDLSVFIGRFQPFHNAHKKIIEHALTLSNRVLVIVGSSRNSQTPKNPWNIDTRIKMIKESINDSRINIVSCRDYNYNDSLWINEIGKLVSDYSSKNEKIAIVGHGKDYSSFYLNFFPQWDLIEVPPYPLQGETIDATKIRNLMFQGDLAFIESVVPKNVYSFILSFVKTREFGILKEEWDYIKEYKKSWLSAPYEPIFFTVDCVVIQSGHVLLIQRGINPGKGKFAMPGGFINPWEKIIDSAIRELKEETRLKVPEKVLRGSIIDSEIFDDPDRSSRGRTITQVFLFKLDDTEKLPKVKGSDDAMDARWVPFSDFNNMEPCMNEDHWHIINHMLNKQ